MADVTRREFVGQSAVAGVGLTAAAAALDRLGEQAVAADDKQDKSDNGIRLCRYMSQKLRPSERIGLYFDDHVVDVIQLSETLGINLGLAFYGGKPGKKEAPASAPPPPPPPSPPPDLLMFLPPHENGVKLISDLHKGYLALKDDGKVNLRIPVDTTKLLVPIPSPKKIILLAGNYNAHIIEGGGKETERKETFPYFFWKPPTTTLTNPEDSIKIPKVSPDHVDWELELGVIMGKRCSDVSEKDALSYVAGYTVCNDVSDRKFKINPGRKERPKDGFFDWLHGKWHDTFMPTGPCVRSAASVADPQKFAMNLKVNGSVMQDANTSQMIFSVAALVSILSSFTTLEPGDIISTGTPAGVGAGRKPPVYLKKGDVVEARIEGIGLLRNPVA